MVEVLMPDKVFEHTGAISVKDIELIYQPDNTVVMRKKRVPQKIPDEIVQKCKKYICKQISDFAYHYSFFITLSDDKKCTGVTIKLLNPNNPYSRTGHAKHNTAVDIYCAEVGIAIAMCRAFNGKKCNYEKIIGIKMA